MAVIFDVFNMCSLGPVNENPALIEMMAWWWAGGKPIYELIID